jgi:excisionase family DNA binding protein
MAPSRAPVRPAELSAPFFSVCETAWLMHCSVSTVRRRMASGLLGFSQEAKGGTVLVSRQDLDGYYERTRVPPSSTL